MAGTGPGSYVTEREEGDTLLLTYLCCEHSLQKVKVKRGIHYYRLTCGESGPGVLRYNEWKGLTCGVSTHYRKWKWRGKILLSAYLWCEHSLQKVKVKLLYYRLPCGESGPGVLCYRKGKGKYIITDLLVVWALITESESEEGDTLLQTYLWWERARGPMLQ